MKMMASGLFAALTILAMAAVAYPAPAEELGSRPESAAQTPPEPTKAVTLVGNAKAQPRERRAKKPKPKDRFLFAVVRFNGELVRSFGVKDAFQTGPGSYRVFFNRDVTECSFVVSVSGTGTDDVHGVADAAHVMGKPKGLYVNTYDISIDSATNSLAIKDAPFHLQVMCPPD
jgi:hypothetical protein